MMRRSEHRERRADSSEERCVILLVDDDEDFRALVREAVQTGVSDAEIIECGNGMEALALLETMDQRRRRRPSVIFLDLDMPVMDGRETLRRLREAPRFASIPVVVLTGVDDDAEERRVLSCGANSYTCKCRRAGDLIDGLAGAARYWTQVHRHVKTSAA